MSVKCPRCDYVRLASDQNPEWECPGCGVAYAKAAARRNAPLPDIAPPPAPLAPPRVSLDAQRRWVGFAMVGLVLFGAWALLKPGGMNPRLMSQVTACRDQTSSVALDAANPTVVLYGTTWCGVCTMARNYFDQHDVPYLDLDIEKDAAARQKFDEFNGRGVPLLWIDGELQSGFDEVALCDALIRSGILTPPQGGGA